MIDILMATHHPDAAMLDAQVKSIQGQTGVSVNLIMREDKQGKGARANFSELLALSSAPYSAFADQDDVWARDKLAKLMRRMEALEAQHGCDLPLLVFCDSRVTDAALNPLPGTFLARQGIDVSRGLALSRLLLQNFIAGNLMLFNAALRRKAGAIPDDALMHDCWMVLVAAAFGRIGFVDEPLLDYRQHGANAVGATSANAGHFWRRMREGGASFRGRLDANIRQAQAFLQRYGEQTPDCVRALARFPQMGYVRRRIALFRHGLFKQGFLRNAALVFLA